MEKLYSVKEAAQTLGGISKWTIHSWLSQGKLQRTKVGRRTMIRESELLKLVKDYGKTQEKAAKGKVSPVQKAVAETDGLMGGPKTGPTEI
jgi:excisionase family DNA binding protein